MFYRVTIREKSETCIFIMASDKKEQIKTYLKPYFEEDILSVEEVAPEELQEKEQNKFKSRIQTDYVLFANKDISVNDFGHIVNSLTEEEKAEFYIRSLRLYIKKCHAETIIKSKINKSRTTIADYEKLLHDTLTSLYEEEHDSFINKFKTK